MVCGEEREGKERKEQEDEWIKKMNKSERAREELREETEGIELRGRAVDEELEKLIRRIKEKVEIKRWKMREERSRK